MRIETLFELGMKRELASPLDMPLGPVLNLGCGKHTIPRTFPLDFPEWQAENYLIEIPNHLRNTITGQVTPPNTEQLLVPCPDNCISGIHAYHFLEHLKDPRRMLREMQRVLIPGGVINICVPHYWGSMAHHDLDHKNTYAIDTWNNTFSAPWYTKDREGWKLRVHFNVMIAITERNSAILTQLVKE